MPTPLTPARRPRRSPRSTGGTGGQAAWQRHRAAALAGAALLLCGIAIYLPINGVAGRYSMPAVWGADLGLAILFTSLVELPTSVWTRATWVLLGSGLLAGVTSNLDKQVKYAARADVLWQALEYLEEQAPHAAQIAWDDRPGTRNQYLDRAEMIHFAWHLKERARTDMTVLLDRVEASLPASLPALLLSGSPAPPADGWRLRHEFKAPYRLGKRCFECYLWIRDP